MLLAALCSCLRSCRRSTRRRGRSCKKPSSCCNRRHLYMAITNGVIEAIGNTPLIALKRASEATGCTILGKAEFMNPGASVKDRAGKWMILEAEKRGELKPG